jgi:acyl-CoA thioesterase
MVLSLEIGIRFVATPVTPWVLQEIEAWHVGDGYATGPARLWDEDGNLCAIATQTANLRLMSPE